MKQLILFFGIAVLPAIAFAQTKRIAHKSHSGSEEAFLVAYENNLFGMEYDNEGVNESAYITPPTPILPVVDTLIFTRSSALPIYRSNSKSDSLFIRQPLLSDTVRKFFKQRIPASCTVPEKKGYVIPYVSTDLPKPPSAGQPWMYIALIAVFAVFTGLFSWQYKQA
jgi:hypothetical protein